jgi:hypothetical protein
MIRSMPDESILLTETRISFLVLIKVYLVAYSGQYQHSACPFLVYICASCIQIEVRLLDRQDMDIAVN